MQDRDISIQVERVNRIVNTSVMVLIVLFVGLLALIGWGVWKGLARPDMFTAYEERVWTLLVLAFGVAGFISGALVCLAFFDRNTRRFFLDQDRGE